MNITLLVGPPGSGKSTVANKLIYEDGDHGLATVYINQDLQGQEGHLELFNKALDENKDIVVDRMNFSLDQRKRYLNPAKLKGYSTKIICLHENFDTCLERMKLRVDHPTIKDAKTASKVLHFFFSKYERVENDEADSVIREWPNIDKPKAIICDLDGTLCNINHRLHYIKGPGKKNWKAFFEGLRDDSPNFWCQSIVNNLADIYKIVFCSGRTDTYQGLTENWLSKWGIGYDDLFMRQRDDFRKDNIVKEVLLDFEILTRYEPAFIIDDRKQVIDMWRKRGYTCLDCSGEDF